MTKYKLIFIYGLMFTFCTDQVPRRPVDKKGFEKAVQKEKDLLLEISKSQVSEEESKIQEAISNRKQKFMMSEYGFWYAYIKKNRKLANNMPSFGDVALLNYEIKDLYGGVLYPFKSFPGERYAIDKNFLFSGFRSAIKLMREGEEMIFIFPSYLAFGLLGDGDKIKGSMPIECVIRLNKLIKTKQN